jgi:hypothetical protein
MARREVKDQRPRVSVHRQERSDRPPVLCREQVELFHQRGEPTASSVAPRPLISGPLPTPRLALTIAQFCEAFNISAAFYYKLKKQRQGPREMKVGAHTHFT